MKLSEIISVERVATGVVVASKKRALEELAKRLAEGAGNVDVEEILAALIAREKLGSTALGHGVAIPHGRIASVKTSVGAFLQLHHPVDYDSHNSQPVDLIFGLLVPQDATGEHLKHLATIAEKFSDDTFCERARRAADAAGLYALLIH